MLKHSLYEEYGIKEYWTVFPKEEKLRLYALENGKYASYLTVNRPNSFESRLFPGLRASLEEIFNIDIPGI